MANDDWGAAEPIRQSVHDLVHAIGTHLGLIPSDTPAPMTSHDKAVADMSKQMNDQRVADANKSFVTPQAADRIRAKANGKK